MPFLVLHCNKIQLEETYKDHSIQPSDHIRANQTLKHIEGIIHMSLQQRQAQGINHLPRKGGLFQCLTTLRVIEFPKRHRFPEAEPSASLFFPSLESCREHWGHLSASSLPNWEKWPQPLLTGHPFQPCHHLWCLPLKAPSCGLNITEPRTAHNISGEAPPTLNIVREISLLSGWLSCVQWIPQNTFTPLTSRGRCWLTLSLLPSAPRAPLAELLSSHPSPRVPESSTALYQLQNSAFSFVEHHAVDGWLPSARFQLVCFRLLIPSEGQQHLPVQHSQ